MKNFMQIFTGVDVYPLLFAIKRRPELWLEDTFLRDYPQGPFADTETIMLRFPVKSVKETQAEIEAYGQSDGQHESIDYPPFAKLPEARQIVFAIMARVQGERLGRVMINKLRPGGRVFPHADTPVHANYYSRFHAVLQSAPGCNFRCGDETIHMDVGTIHWFNNKLEHEVVNNSAIDRIHMIVDCKTSAQ